MKKVQLHKVLWVVLFGTMSLATLNGCYRKDLYLGSDPGNVKVETSIYDIQLELLWGFDWRTQWQYTWDSVKYGPIGYTAPTGVRATIYEKDQVSFHRVSPFTRNFDVEGGRVSLTGGKWYDMLFFNNGTEYIVFSTDEAYSFYRATTRLSSKAAYTRAYINFNQPELLYGTFIVDEEVSNDPDDYEKEVEENGDVVYIYHIDAVMRPYTFIYLIQVMVLNNYDADGKQIVGGAEGATVTGLADGVDLFDRLTSDSVVAVTFDDVKPMQTNRYLTLPDGTKTIGDIFAGRMLTWGLPRINPLDEMETRSTTEPVDSNYVGIGLRLSNGAVYTVTKNITEQMFQHPAGGVITVVLDAATLPKVTPPSGSGGGFDAEVKDWDKEENAEVTI